MVEDYGDLIVFVRERVQGLQTMYIEEGKKLEEALILKIEEAKNDHILAELRKLNDRLDKIEARLPEEEET